MFSDSQVFQGIVAEFKNNPALHHAELDLHVKDGVVTIAGRANSLSVRKEVERAARRVAGIKTLIVDIGAAAIPLIRSNRRDLPQHETASLGRYY